MKLNSTFAALVVLCIAATSLFAQPANVWRVQIPGLVEAGDHDAEIVLFQRDDKILQGYVLTPTRDNLVHRIDATPAPSSEWIHKDGTPLEVPKFMKGNYAYKNKEYLTWKASYQKGEIDLKQDPAPALTISDSKITGLVDVLFLGVDTPNPAGRQNHSIVYRIDLDLTVLNGKGSGTAKVWPYSAGDITFGRGLEKRSLKASAQLDRDYWKAPAGQEYAEGTDWPMAHGPTLTASAAEFEGELVKNLHDARLVWVAEDPLPSGRSGSKARGGFTMFPNMWKTLGFGGYGAPIIADNKVFVHVHGADEEKILADERTARDSYVRLGLDPRALGIEYGMIRDTLFCFDAQSGKKLWHFFGKTGSLSRFSKQGMASTPCYLDGKVYFRGNAGLYCLNAETGEKVWQKGGQDRVSFGIGAAPNEGSVVAVANILILMNQLNGKAQTAGIDPKTGELKWALHGIGAGGIGLPGILEMGGKTLIALPRELYKPGKRDKDKTLLPETFVIVDPADGSIVLESDLLGNTGGQLMVHNDVVMGNWVKDLIAKKGSKKKVDPSRLGAVRVTEDGADVAWKKENIQTGYRRTLNVLHRGILYVASRHSGFVALDATNSEILARRRSIYQYSHTSHNWTWHVAAKDRIFTDGVGMWTTGDQGLRPMPGRLSLDITGGYAAPTKPAIADGRIVIRLADKLVCYDLRIPMDYKTEVISLTAEDAVVGGVTGSEDIKLRIRKTGEKLVSLGASGKNWTAGEREFTLASWTGMFPYRKTLPTKLQLSETSLSGPASVRLGWHYEPWEFELERNGDSFRGTYTCKVLPLKTPIESSDTIAGDEKEREDGLRRIMLYMNKSTTNAGGAKAGVANNNMMIILVCDGDIIKHGWAQAGRVNTANHELDFSGLTLKGDSITGKAIVLMHDDRYHDLNPTHEDHVSSGEGGMLAVENVLNVKREGVSWRGTHKSTIGVAWERSGTISGTLSPDAGQED